MISDIHNLKEHAAYSLRHITIFLAPIWIAVLTQLQETWTVDADVLYAVLLSILIDWLDRIRRLKTDK